MFKSSITKSIMYITAIMIGLTLTLIFMSDSSSRLPYLICTIFGAVDATLIGLIGKIKNLEDKKGEEESN